MPKQQVITRTAKGLYLQYNPIHEVPEGGLIEADNVQIDQEGVISKRRGFERYGVAFSPDSIFEYQGKIVGFESNGTARYDAFGDGSEWRAYSGSFLPPDASTRIHAKEAQLNWYFTTSNGVMKSDSVESPPLPSGMPTGLDVRLTKVGTGGSWLALDSQVAYRIVWGREDENGVLLVGAPSFRRIVTNAKVGATLTPSGNTITANAPSHGLNVNDIIVVADAQGETPGESGGYENSPSGGSFVVDSVLTDSFTYEQEGTPDDASGTMNFGRDLDVQLEFTIPDDIVEGDFYDVYRSEITSRATDEPSDSLKRATRVAVTQSNVDAGVITVLDDVPSDFRGPRLYTNAEIEGIGQQNSRPPFACDIEAFRGHLFYFNTKRPHVLEITLNNISPITNGQSSITLTQGSTSLTYLFNGTEDIPNQRFQTVTSNTALADNVEETMHSFCRAINRDPANSLFYAYYISQALDDPGRVAIEARSASTGPFTATVDSGDTASVFTPTIPTSGTDYVSENSAFVNRLYRSKIQEFEAVPELNFDEVGDASKKGLRCLALRDSLILLKEDGVFRLSGESERNFVLKKLDGTQRLRAPESAVVLDNAVWGLTDDGVVRISEAGTSIMSRQIEDELLKILNFPNFESATHSVAYESEQLFVLFTQEFPTDTAPQIAWCYNILTKTWTRWRLAAKDGLVQFSTDKVCLSHPSDGFLLRERKDFAATDYADERFPVSFTDPVFEAGDGGGTTTINVPFSTRKIKPGWIFEHDPGNVPGIMVVGVEEVSNNNFSLRLEKGVPALVAGNADLIAGIDARVKWAPESAGSVGVMKQFSFVQIFLEKPVTRCTFFSQSDLVADEEGVVIAADKPAGSQVVRVSVPRDKQRGRFLSVAFEHSTSSEDFRIFQVSYTVRPYGERTTLSPR